MVRPKTTPPRRKRYPQASPWLALEATKQGFHPGLRPRPQQTGDGWTRRQVAGLNYHPRRHLIVDGDALTTNHQHNNHTYSTDRGPRWPNLRGEGLLRLPEQQLWPPLAMAEGHAIDHHWPYLACRLQQRGSSAALQAGRRCQITTNTRTPEGRITAPSAKAAAMAALKTSTTFNRVHRELSLPPLGTGAAATVERPAAGKRSMREAWWRLARVSPETLARSDAWGRGQPTQELIDETCVCPNWHPK
jgi:hypothetical protein